MERTWYICFEDKQLGKKLFAGPNTGFYSDFQSANAFSKPEVKKALPGMKKHYKEKRLKAIQIILRGQLDNSITMQYIGSTQTENVMAAYIRVKIEALIKVQDPFDSRDMDEIESYLEANSPFENCPYEVVDTQIECNVEDAD